MKKLHIILMILGILTIALSTFFTSPLLVSADPDYDEFFRHSWWTPPGYYVDEITFTMQFTSGEGSGLYEVEMGTKIPNSSTTHLEIGLVMPEHDPGHFLVYLNVAEPEQPSHYEIEYVNLGWSRRYHTFWFWVKKEWGKTWHFKMYDCNTQELLYDLTFDHATVENCSPIYAIHDAIEYWDYGFDGVHVTTMQTAHTVPNDGWFDWRDYDWTMGWTDPMPEHGRHDPLFFVDDRVCCQGPAQGQQATFNVTERAPGDTTVYPPTTQYTSPPPKRPPLNNQWVVPDTILQFDEFTYLPYVGNAMGAEYHRVRAWQVPE